MRMSRLLRRTRRDARADADLIGIPAQVLVGARGLATGVVEVKTRAAGERSELAPRNWPLWGVGWNASVIINGPVPWDGERGLGPRFCLLSGPLNA
ncbi:MAG: His/Gly/Thr/Pro-type tRNA ligase C-terminal domain-containing protein [Acidimicrobiales bacterium]